MAAKSNAAVAEPNVGNFEPATEWITEDALDTLMVYAPGIYRYANTVLLWCQPDFRLHVI